LKLHAADVLLDQKPMSSVVVVGGRMGGGIQPPANGGEDMKSANREGGHSAKELFLNR